MSKLTIILASVAVVALIILASLGIYFRSNLQNNTAQEGTASSVTNTNTNTSEATSTDSQSSIFSEVDRSYTLIIGDESQDISDFDSEVSDQSQIKVDSVDLLNLSKSYETKDF